MYPEEPVGRGLHHVAGLLHPGGALAFAARVGWVTRAWELHNTLDCLRYPPCQCPELGRCFWAWAGAGELPPLPAAAVSCRALRPAVCPVTKCWPPQDLYWSDARVGGCGSAEPLPGLFPPGGFLS